MHASQKMLKVTADKSSSDTSASFIDYIFNPHQPKFLFDDIYHFSMRHYGRHANNRSMLPVVKLMTAIVLERMGALNAPILFVPEAITNGKEYVKLGQKYEQRIRDVRGHLSLYRLSEIINKDELDAHTEKNKNHAMTRLEGFRRLCPDHSVMSPTGMEAMLKTLVKDAGFTNYQMLRDEDFEAFWIAVCLNVQRGGFADDAAYSRNGNFETFAMFQVQYGLVPFRPDGDIDVVMPGKRNATPYDYLEMLFAHLLDVVPCGITSDLSIKMAMRMIMLEEMRTSGMAHPVWGALPAECMNPNLRALGRSHDREFSKLRRDILVFIKSHKLENNLDDLYGLDGYDNLRAYYHEQKIPSLILPHHKNDGRDKKYKDESRKKMDMAAQLKKKSLFNILSLSIPYQLDGEFFSQEPSLMPDLTFSKLLVAEQVALKAFMGLSETVKPPGKSDLSILLLTDRRGGRAASSYANQLNVLIPPDARGLKSRFSDNNYEAQVKVKNIEKAKGLTKHLQQSHPLAHIISTEQIEHDADIYRLHRLAISAPGSDRLSSQAKTIYAQELLRRQTTLAIFDQAWETSASLLAARLYARKIQLGLVVRPNNLPIYHLNIADLSTASLAHKAPYAIASLADDLKVLTTFMKTLITDKTEDYPRQMVRGLLEVIVIIDLYYNKNMNQSAGEAKSNKSGLIEWQSVPLSLKEGLESRKDEILDLRAQARDLILRHGLNELSPDELTGQLEFIDPDYLRAHSEISALQNAAMRKKPRTGSSYKLRGYNAV